MSPISRYFKSPPGIPSVGAEDRFSALGRPGALGRSIPAAIQGQSHGDCAGHPWIAEASQRAGEASYGPSGICLGTYFLVIFIEKSSIIWLFNIAMENYHF